MNNKLVAMHKEPYTGISASEGVLFMTYQTLVAGNAKGQSRMSQIIEWCGPNFDGTLVFDECHKAKNLYPEKGAQPTKVGKGVVAIQKALPRARVVYCSATGATAPRSMGYMERLGLWGENESVKTFETFLKAGACRSVFRHLSPPHTPGRLAYAVHSPCPLNAAPALSSLF